VDLGEHQFRPHLRALKQPVTPLDCEQTDAMIDGMEASFARIESDLAEAMAPFLNKQ
jgi:hypothetical protein